MRILQIGCGTIGNYIKDALLANPSVEKLCICDFFVEKPYEENGISYIRTFDENTVHLYDCFIVATPASTHFEIIGQLLKWGAKSIFAEKPVVTDRAEYEYLLKLKGDARIVAGYILRHSEPLFALKYIIRNFCNNGFSIEMCSVVYQKHLPFDNGNRTKNDLGVFEEIVHIWDFLFNFLGFRQAEYQTLENRIEMDPCSSDRAIFAELSYYLRFEKTNTFVNILSSFKAKERKRDFYFHLKNDNGERRQIILSFDTVKQLDRLLVTELNGKILYQEEFLSKQKLGIELSNALNFFEKGEANEIALFEDEDIIIDLYKETVLTMQNNQWLKRGLL